MNNIRPISHTGRPIAPIDSIGPIASIDSSIESIASIASIASIVSIAPIAPKASISPIPSTPHKGNSHFPLFAFRFSLTFSLFTLIFSLIACTADIDLPTEAEGTLCLTLPEVSTAVTRTTPAEIGAPVAGDFHLTVTNVSGRAVYDGNFTTGPITLPVGEYAIQATYGNDALIALDAPRYAASANATIEEDTTAYVALNATVANALVSARFGIDDAERARFDRFYSDYSLYVNIGNQGIPITSEEPWRSVYVRPGSTLTFRFQGHLRLENDRLVTTTLTAADLPTTLDAADHAIITLTLPDPESALTVAIAKVEVEPVTLDETIPLSWLPVAVTVPLHQYDADGILVGTNLLITDSYPGMTWRAVITNAAGTTVRTVEGTGALESHYNSSANATNWPYLPQGQYKASYYIINDGTATFQSSRDFTVPAPNISVAVSGYTSYDKYLAGDIDVANACERLTIYEPSVSLSVANALLQNSKYAYTFSYNYNGTSTNVPAGGNTHNIGNITGQAVREQTYPLRADATFDGVAATAQRAFRITGLPYSLNLRDHGEWDSSGGVDWFDNDVRLGHLSTGGQTIRTDIAICLPPSTYFCADYNVNVHSATVGTTFSIDVGTQKILSITEDGGIAQNKDNLHSGTTGTYHDDEQYTTSISCNNSYGAGQTCTHIYSLTFKYASH